MRVMIADIHQELPGTVRIEDALPGHYLVMDSLPLNPFAHLTVVQPAPLRATGLGRDVG